MLKMLTAVSSAALIFQAIIPSIAAANPMENACSDRTIHIQIGTDQTGSRAQVFTDLSFYMLNGLSPDKSCTVTRNLEIHCALLYDGACTLMSTAVSSIDYEDLRDFYQEHHLATITVRKHDDYVKKTLREFVSVTDYRSWQKQVIRRSNIKQKTRVIYRSPANFPQQISVSETYDCDNGDLNAERLETEISVRRHGQSRTFEFYTYDKNGDLAESSAFPAGERPSPTICVSCHYNPSQRTVSRFIPN